MSNKHLSFYRFAILFQISFFLLSLVSSVNANAAGNYPPVAHAGGSYKELSYTNSLEALDASYARGFRIFEIDLMLTRDDKIVCKHYWDNPDQVPSYKEVKHLNAKLPYTACDATSLGKWMMQHKDAMLVTDVKSVKKTDQMHILRSFSRTGFAQRVIPQIYAPDEYERVSELGYKNIIFTLYMYEGKDEEILPFLAKNKLYALTMPQQQVRNGRAQKLKGNYPIYTHTIDSCAEFAALKKLGADGIYTNKLAPADCR